MCLGIPGKIVEVTDVERLSWFSRWCSLAAALLAAPCNPPLVFLAIVMPNTSTQRRL